ncbi:MAG: heavy-metal-associated domain-containing protein [Rhodospirillales bacterium]|nr:heavy-metal-associated domain-containing protein [Acetobacter sp.]
MIRRRFLGMATFTGLGGLAALSAKGSAETRSMTRDVQGFTCITCATGLETLLQREKGVQSVKASYPSGTTTVIYDARTTSEAEIVKAIESMGFKARPHSAN